MHRRLRDSRPARPIPAARREQSKLLPLALSLALTLAVDEASARAGAPTLRGLATIPPVAVSSSPTTAAFHPHRIIVKFAERVSDCASCMLARRARFASVTGSDSLDRLNRRFDVVSARGLFFDDNSGGNKRSQGYARRIDDARRRFPQRSARAAADAVAPDLSNIFVLDLGRDADPLAAAAAFAADPDVEYAEPDYRVHAALTPNDPYWSSMGSARPGAPDLWGLHAMQADLAWDRTNGEGTVVAVIDTGIDPRHPDIAANMWKNPGEIARNGSDDDGNGYVDDIYGWDFTRNRPAVKDQHGHGTHVAGTVAASGDNGEGVIGVAWGSRVMSVQGLNSRGVGYTSDLAKAIVYAAENGADVLNNSWGGGGSSSELRDAVTTATSLGAVVVFAAGNSSSAYLGPAADPRVIAVAATAFGDQRTGFSNYGNDISVSAPGEAILSLRGPGKVRGTVVGRRYRVLSGTSMAAPHASGLAALVLADNPALSIDEVRWHLELNADQPGAEGYEGQAWNPYFGWGRINAARAFDTPPVTTRLKKTSFPLTFHGFAGTTAPAAASVAFSFTTRNPVPWSMTTPAFLHAQPSTGSGLATVALDLDLSDSEPGSYTGTVSVSAPSAVDGGAGVAATAVVHQDSRVGERITLSDQYYDWGYARPAVASDGQGVLTAWVESPPDLGIRLMASYTADDGSVTGPFVVSAGDCAFFCVKKNPASVSVAFDGTNFLVVWSESIQRFLNENSLKTKNYTSVNAVRVSRQGQVLDASPAQLTIDVEAESGNGGFDRYFENVGVAFDGSFYTVVWSILDFGSASRPLEVFMAQVAASGHQSGATQSIYPIAGQEYHLIQPHLACVSGSCLLAWIQGDGETNPFGKYIYKVFGRRFQAGTALDAAPSLLSRDMNWLSAVATSPTGYLLAGWRYNRPAEDVSGNDVVIARVAPDGTALDPETRRVNNSAPEGLPYTVIPSGAAYDGRSFVVTWEEFGPEAVYPLAYAMAARVDANGDVAGAEPEGLLLLPTPMVDSVSPAIAPTATKSLLVWNERSASAPRHIYAQGVLAR